MWLLHLNQKDDDMKIENPIGVSGLVLSFLVAVTGLVSLIWSVPVEILGGINLVLATGVAMVSQVVRRIP